MNNPIPDIVKAALAEKRLQLVSQRDEAIARAAAPFDRQIADLDKYGNGTQAAQGGTMTGTPLTLRESLSSQIKDAANWVIASGNSSTTEDIYKILVDRGVQFPDSKSPLLRITKVLSGSGQYNGHRSRGWSNKGEVPKAGRPSATSGATMSTEDEQYKKGEL